APSSFSAHSRTASSPRSLTSETMLTLASVPAPTTEPDSPGSRTTCRVLPREPASRVSTLLFAGDVAAEEDQVAGRDRNRHVERAYPEGAHDRRPVGGRPEEAVPRLELRAQQIRADRLRPRQHAEQLHEERPHQRADDGRGAVARDRREEEPERRDRRHRPRV